MVTSEFVMTTAPDLLSRQRDGGKMSPMSIAGERWCSTMVNKLNGLGGRGFGSSATEPVCGKLRALFDDVAAEPVPEQLANLVERLERALERGELPGLPPKDPDA
jgi:hypothetical protein